MNSMCAALLAGMAITSGCRTNPSPGPTAVHPDTLLAPGDHVVSLHHDGRDRRYLVHVPASAGSTPALVVALHGGGGTAQGFKDENGLDAVSDREGFVAVYPDGTGPNPDRLLTWNAGPNCCGSAADNEVDDVGFLDAVLDDLQRRRPYDPTRVYMTGHSNGAIMTYRFALEAADRVAAIVPVAGAMAADDPAPSRRVPVLHIHSVDDPRALYEGGEGPPFPGTTHTVIHEPVEAGLGFWVGVNGCSPTPRETESRTGRGRDRGQTLTRLVWDPCADGTAVEHLRLTGVGHGWPGVRVGLARQSLIGPPTTLIDASEEVWAFVSRFSR